jgi:phosphatidate phosphatase APP1
MPNKTTFRFILFFIFLTFLLSFIADARDGDQIDNNEKVVFFPSYGYFNSSHGEWVIIIQGHIFEPSASSIKRSIAKSGFENFTGSAVQNENEFWRRVRPFISDNERSEKVKIRLGRKTYTMPDSTAGGRITGKLTISNSEAQQLVDSKGWITYTATSENNRLFTGKVLLIQAIGVSIISDIDDTIKITEVYKDRKSMLINTFNRPMKAAPGMSAFYRKLNNSDTRFHYLSGSPWQLFPILDEFLSENSFPAGTFNMKEFRVNPGSEEFWNFIVNGSTQDLKKEIIKNIMTNYPNRKFILIGDSGEHDPEIYGWAAGTYPKQVKEIYIRNVTQEIFGNQRMKDSFGTYIDKVRLIDMNNGSIEHPFGIKNFSSKAIKCERIISDILPERYIFP